MAFLGKTFHIFLFSDKNKILTHSILPFRQDGLTYFNADACKIEDGKIVAAWTEFDFMKMYSQVGA
jgi:hypothetical protein